MTQKINYTISGTGYALDNMTTHDGTHYKQPTRAKRSKELWQKWREMRDRNEAAKRYGVRSINAEAVDRYHELEILKAVE